MTEEKAKIVSRKIIKGMHLCEHCKKSRLECRKCNMSNNTKIYLCSDCMTLKMYTGKKMKKIRPRLEFSAFETSRRKH